MPEQDPDRTEPVPPVSFPEAPIRLLAPGTRIGDRYEVRRVLGSGGYAVVYLAFDRELRREVALKVLRADRMEPSSLRRFRREASVAREAASPRLVRIFDIGSSEQAVYLTMEVVEGESLRERLLRGPLPIEEAVRIAAQVLEGLAALHALGIIHRDIKPGNILLAEAGEVKLADFGLALQWESDETRVTVGQGVLGTVDYVSPEQALGEEGDARSDLYSCGVVLFEMLAGRLPYEEKSPLGSLLGRLRKPPPDVRRLRPEVPGWLSAVVAKLLEKDRSQRYVSAATALADLRSENWWRTWRGRLRPVRVAVASALALLVAAGAFTAWRIGQRPRFSYLAPLTPAGGIAGYDTEGKVLWSLPRFELARNATVIRERAGGPLLVAAVLMPPLAYAPQQTNFLSILDAETGKVRERVRLPSAAERFPGFADRYGTAVRAYDLDRDGGDEVLVTYVHSTLWPSYTVLYEPRLRRAREVFVASGHHWLQGAADLDGDRRPELIFLGINNRMGWFSGAAAVRIDPWVNDAGPPFFRPASTPDEAYIPGLGSLLWYALTPRGWPGPDKKAAVDPVHRKLTVYFQNASEIELDFDGFLSPHPAGLPAAERQRARLAAYGHLREANRLIRAELPREALPECDAASRLAERAADPLLGEWISRVRAKALIAADRFSEGETSFRELAAKSAGSASEIAFDAGRALHLRGQLDRATAWYRQGLGPGGTVETGRGKHEFLEGAVLALVEEGRWEEALSEVDRFDLVYPSESLLAAYYREYVRWRSGETPILEKLGWKYAGFDLVRYWYLEFRMARRHDLEHLLHDLPEEEGRASETRELLASLRGEVLEKLGRRSEALEVAREAYRLIRQDAGASTIARGHRDLVAQRFARLARAAGRTAEADAALAQLHRWRRGRREEARPSR